ncbi:protein kinase [Streptosporangium sp. NPDC050855]|uniref:serine/threonine-protein kinase n=1 Tax=Streptosporangium sp. NPDC050855 TaxID=3366194 RepID=UPI0037AAB4FB
MTERKVAGRYRLIEHIGEGGMGIVWRAHDELLDRIVAVKEVRYGGVDETARADLNRRTIREARTAGRLDHPSVIIVHDVVEEEGRPWIVMQLVRSRSLGEIVRVDGPLPPERVASVGLHVLGALRAAHAAGVLHRDVKPENVLLADDGRVVLTDFGIASMTQEKSITRTGAMIGTPAFLPPERLHGLPATPESDLWSLGATLYAALEGRPPFERPTAAATMMAVLHGEPTPMARSGPLETAILGLLARDPAARMVPEQAEALLGRAAGHPSSGPSPSGHVPMGPSPSGHVPPGRAFPGHRPPGDARPGSAVPGHVSPGPAPSGHVSPGHAPQRHAAPGHGPQGHAPGGYGTQGYQGYAPQGHTPQGHAAPGHPSPAFGQGAFPGTGGGQADRPAPWAAAPWSPDAASQNPASHDPSSQGQAYGLHTGGPTHQDRSPYGPAHTLQDPSAHTRPRPHGRQGRQGHGSEPLPPNAWPLGEQTTGTTGTTGTGTAAPSEPATGTTVPVPVLLAGGLALAVLAGVGGWLIMREGDDAPDPRPSGSVVTTGAPTPSEPATGPTTATPRPGRTLPAGWRLHRDPMGFTVGVPAGWRVKRFPGRDRVEFRAPGSDSFLWIESTDDPEKDPVRHWEKVERAGTADGVWPGYRRIGIAELTYRGMPAADWEFTYLKNGVRTHVLDRGFRTAADKPYAIYWESPESEWKRSAFEAITGTFRP